MENEEQQPEVAPEQTPQEPEISVSDKKTFNYPLFVGAIVVVVAVIVGYFVIVQNKSTVTDTEDVSGDVEEVVDIVVENLTESWKTYSNEKYDYLFKHPASWLLANDPYNTVASPTANSVSFNEPDEYYLSFSVDVKNINNCPTIETCLEENRAKFAVGEISSGLTNSDIDGFDLMETIKRPESGNWEYYVYYAYKNPNLYTAHTASNIEDNTVTKPIIEQIFSTFKFTSEPRR